VDSGRLRKIMKKALTILVALMALAAFSATAVAKKPSTSKFYDFSDQVIDGELKKPTALFTNSRQTVKFDRLLRLKKTFLPALEESGKDPAIK
jgi:hypothetical protein